MRIWFKSVLIALFIGLLGFIYFCYFFTETKKEQVKDSINPKLLEAPASILSLKDSMVITGNSKIYTNFALRLSDYYANIGRFDSAATYLELAAKGLPNEESYERTGLMYYKAFESSQGKEEEAMLNKALFYLEKLDSKRVATPTKLALANVYIAANQPAKAKKLLLQALDNDSTNQEALRRLGKLGFQQQRYKEATKYYGQLVALDSNQVEALYFLAVSLYKNGQQTKAQMLFKKLKLSTIPNDMQTSVEEYLNDIK